jgi:integrase
MIKARVRKRDGRRVYDVRLRDPEGKEYSRTFDTKKQAEAYEDAERVARRKGAWVDPRGAELTFETVANAWLSANPSKRPSAMATDEFVVQARLLPELASRPIGSIAPPDVQRLVNSWSKTLAPRSVRRSYSVLHAIFVYAVAADLLSRSPCRNVNLPAATSTRRRHLDADQVASIAAATDERYRAMVWIGAVLGLRWAEVAGLQVRAVDLLRGTVTVLQTITRDQKGSPVVGPPKSKAGERTLAIPAALADILAEHLAARGITGADPDRYLFEAPDGGPLRYPNWLRRVWKPAVAAANCPDAGFHDLRRANATALVTGGVDVKTAQSRLGHADPRMTIGLYAQQVPTLDRRAADTLGAAFLEPETRDGRGIKTPRDGIRPRDGRGMEARTPDARSGGKALPPGLLPEPGVGIEPTTSALQEQND